MTELEAQAKDYAMSRKLNLSEPTDITHVIELIDLFYIGVPRGNGTICEKIRQIYRI